MTNAATNLREADDRDCGELDARKHVLFHCCVVFLLTFVSTEFATASFASDIDDTLEHQTFVKEDWEKSRDVVRTRSMFIGMPAACVVASFLAFVIASRHRTSMVMLKPEPSQSKLRWYYLILLPILVVVACYTLSLATLAIADSFQYSSFHIDSRSFAVLTLSPVLWISVPMVRMLRCLSTSRFWAWCLFGGITGAITWCATLRPSIFHSSAIIGMSLIALLPSRLEEARIRDDSEASSQLQRELVRWEHIRLLAFFSIFWFGVLCQTSMELVREHVNG